MTEIPQQLKKPDFRFVLLKAKDKIPIEKEWTTINHTFYDPVLLSHIKHGGNYGIVCGYGNITVVDSDTVELDEATTKLPETFTVKTGRGLTHKYFIISGLNKKIPLIKNGVHFGEIQSHGSQIVCPGSIHPNGKRYEVLKDVPIATITKEQLFDVIAPFREPEWQKSLINITTEDTNLPLENIIDLTTLRKTGNEYQGSHPVHGSTGGSNFRVNVEKGVWFCFRCNSGGGALQLIAVLEGIAPCSNPRILVEDFKRVLKIAEEKFGYKPDEDSMNLLKNPELFAIITETEFNKKIVGENDNRKALFLIGCGVFVENHQIASFNICVNSESGAGKDFITKNILSIFPKRMVESRSRISPTAFTYWHNEPDWTWNGKICYLQDIEERVLNSDTFKVMVSDGSHATIVIDHKAVDIEIHGKPVVFITTATANPKNEMLRRFPILTLDETEGQTKKIMEKQAENAKAGINLLMDYSEPLKKALGFLKRVNVTIPFADKIVEKYPYNHLIMRTHFYRLLDYIKASAALHQYQRKMDENGSVIAQTEDYNFAIIALKRITQNALMIPLTKKQSKFLEMCKEFNGWFSAPEAIAKCKFLSQQSVYDYLDRLQEYFFDTDIQDRENSKKPVKVFLVKKTVNVSIPTAEECGFSRSDISDRFDGIDIINRIDARQGDNSINSNNYTSDNSKKNQNSRSFVHHRTQNLG